MVLMIMSDNEKLINDFNTDNKNRISQLTLISDKLKQFDGDM